jgi:hypothetical protein
MAAAWLCEDGVVWADIRSNAPTNSFRSVHEVSAGVRLESREQMEGRL